MVTRRLFLLVIILILAPTAGSAANSDGDALAPAASRLYLPVIAHAGPPLAQITGLAYSYYNAFFGGPKEEIYTVRADGSRLARLTDNDWENVGPRWSHDGTFIAWTQTDGASPSVHQEAWIMNADGSNAQKVGNLMGASAWDWSPVENRLLIRQYDPQAPAGQQYALYLTTPSAPAPTLVIGFTDLGSAGWSPSGQHLWFETAAPGYSWNLYTAYPDGSGIRFVGNTYPSGPSWSPDGAWVAYRPGVSSNWDVYVSRADGSETRAVATSAFREDAGPWLPNSAGFFVTRRLDSNYSTSEVDLYSITTGTTVPFLSSVPPHGFTVLGVSPDGKSVVYQESAASTDGYEYSELKLRTIDHPASTTISPSLQGQPFGGIQFGGWSADGRQVAYSHYIILAPHSTDSKLYVANVDGTAPAYQLLDSYAGGPTWLPRSTWLSAYMPWQGERLYNPRTGEQFDLPRSAEDSPLVIVQWRVTP